LTARPRSRRLVPAFTLLELLIVCVLIAALGAVAVPSFARLFKTSKVEQAVTIIMGALWRASGEAQRLRMPVAVFYGEKPGPIKSVLYRPDSNGIGNWRPGDIDTANNPVAKPVWVPVSLPAYGELEMWTVMPTTFQFDAACVPYVYPEYVPRTTVPLWQPWSFQVSPLTLLATTLPADVSCVGGTLDTSIAAPRFDCAAYQKSPLGEPKRRSTVFKPNGSIGHDYGSQYCYEYLCVYEEATGNHVVVSIGNRVTRVRPKIRGYNILRRVGSATNIPLNQIPAAFENYPGNM
jgi:type II secretory pathway pseudopilin PulG